MTVAERFTRSREIVQNQGVIPLFRESTKYIFNAIADYWLQLHYRRQYGNIAPRRDERLLIDPRDIEYSIYSKHMYSDTRSYPNYGILDGSWDLQKQHWRDSPIWDGLRERFEERKSWEETTYYRTAVRTLEAGESLGRLDGPQTIEHFENYLQYLDSLYDDIETNGYDRSSVITVYVGRNGEWIVGHGNHRRTIARIVGVDSIPVRIKYRHCEWQRIRSLFANATSIEEVHSFDTHRSHPDIPDVCSE